MTHGEEPGPDTHTDSAVLTYLEGLLMHPVAAGAGPGATATRRSEASHGNQEQANKVAQPFQLPHGPAMTPPKPGNNGPSLGASQHLKKARLLYSGAWTQPGTQRMSSPPAELNGQQGAAGLQNGVLEEGSPHGGESTLLASLLQSFSSRLQSVAMSQQQTNNKPADQRSPPLPEAPPPPPSAAKEAGLPCYGTASSRLKGLMRKSKLQNHGGTPYSRRGHHAHQDRPTSESPRSAHGDTSPSASTNPASSAGDAVSCAERLKAVANLVKIRSSPAPSPKPSVACSQLALLLSSEAHLQQYSRQHALKTQTQLPGRSASERLAAMATQQGQDKRPPSAGDPATPGGSPDALSSLTAQNGTAAATTLPRSVLNNSSQRSPSLLQAQSSPHPVPPSPPSHSLSHSSNSLSHSSHSLSHSSHSLSHSSHSLSHSHSLSQSLSQTQANSQQHAREKRGLDATRPSRPPQTCSSLLLLLLNNHNNQKQLTKNGHLEDDCGVLQPPSRGSSVTSDSECSTQERSLAKESSDAESSYSSCSPIDLSMRGRAPSATRSTRPKSTSSTTAFSSSTPSASPAMFSSVAQTAFSPSSSTIHPPTPAFSSSSSSSSCLDKLTESLINKWKPEPSGPKVPQSKELEMSPDLKSHPKVTLMQLLLERRNNDKVNKIGANPDLPHDVTPGGGASRAQSKGSSPWEEVRTHSPLDRPGPQPPPLPLYSHGRDQGSTPSPYSYTSPHVQSSPLDLCKSKPYSAEKASEPAFSASKLLQNLAQCGTGSPSPPGPPGKDLSSQELEAGRPLALLERLNAPLQRNAPTPLSDGPSGSGTPFGRREASPPSSQIENLLERRTVLQLLLGTGSAPPTASAAGLKDRSSSGSGRRSVETAAGAGGVCFEKPHSTPVICDSSNGPAADIKVKAEPGEEVGVSAAPAVHEDMSSRKRRGGHAHERRSPYSEHAQQDLKPEPRPAEVIAKYGLLSQLLKQQTATYYTSSAQTQTQTQTQTRPCQVKQEEQRDYHQGPGPKKKRLCPELAESLNNSSPQRAADRGGSSSLPLVPQEEPNQRVVKEEEPLVRRSPPGEALPRESRGFNVLKQLLLSDNCLKELSQQPRGTPSPSVLLQANGKANGSVVNQPGYNHDLLHLPWHPHGPSPLLPSHLRPLLTPPGAGDSSHRRSPWGGRHPPAPCQDSTKRDPPPPPPLPLPVKRELESPVLWGGRGEEEEGCDSSPDSPRLTRSNPILYYMLQKGSAQLRREMMRDQGEGGPQGGAGVRVKEEPVSDMHAYDHRLSSTHHSSPPAPPHNDKHSHRSQWLSQSSDKW